MKTKRLTVKAGSHKEVTVLLVGTGLPDGPKRQKFDTQKARLTPTDFRSLSGFVYSVRQIGI